MRRWCINELEIAENKCTVKQKEVLSCANMIQKKKYYQRCLKNFKCVALAYWSPCILKQMKLIKIVQSFINPLTIELEYLSDNFIYLHRERPTIL